MTDQKSIFGVLVALGALFCLWMWASGNWQKLYTAATGTGTGSAGGATANAAGASTGTSAVAPVPAATAGAVTVPTYVALSSYLPNPGSIGGYTSGGASSGGVSLTPTVFNASNSVPVYNMGSGSFESWLSSLWGGGSESPFGPSDTESPFGPSDGVDPVGGSVVYA